MDSLFSIRGFLDNLNTQKDRRAMLSFVSSKGFDIFLNYLDELLVEHSKTLIKEYKDPEALLRDQKNLLIFNQIVGQIRMLKNGAEEYERTQERRDVKKII